MSKSFFISIPVIAIFVLILINPSISASGAYNGFTLWYSSLLPALFPFMIISSFMVQSGVIDYIISYIYKFSGKMSFNPYYIYILITGFLCGFPMGAASIDDLYSKGCITKDDGNFLLPICNNLSPAFIMSYVGSTLYKDIYKTQLLLFFTYAPSIITGLIVYSCKKNTFVKKNPPLSHSDDIDISVLDKCILKSIISITKIGAYIIIFSIMCEFFSAFIKNSNIFLAILSATFEITTGCSYICHLLKATDMSFLITIIALNFGGLCSVMQTYSITKGSFSLTRYITFKLINASVCALLFFIFRYI